MGAWILVSAITSVAALGDVESKSVTGFTALNVPAGAYRMIGCNFQTIGSTNVSIQALLAPSELYADKTGNSAKSDQIMVWNKDHFDVYTYSFDKQDNKYFWADKRNKPATITFSTGEAFFYKRSAESPATKLTLSGMVLGDTTSVIQLPTGFSMMP